MPAALVSKVAKQLGKDEKSLEKMWNKIKNAVMKNPKYKGYPKNRLYRMITGAFIKSSGYKPKNESVVVVIPVIGDETAYTSVVKESGLKFPRITERPDGTQAIVGWCETVPKLISEAYGLDAYDSFYDNFNTIQSAISRVASRYAARERDDGKPDTPWDDLEEKARKAVFAAANMSDTDYKEEDDYYDWFRVMFDDDKTGFHVLKAHQIRDAMAWFHTVYEYDKKLVLRLIREGLMFESHVFVKYTDLGC